jgi:hypothetical protein
MNVIKFKKAWFKAVQTMASFAFITNSLMIIFLVVTATTNFRASVKCLTITATLGALTCVFALIAVIVFGVATDTYRWLDKYTGLGLDIFSDRGKWMPRPEYTFLSWSYICEVFVGIFSLISSKYELLFLFYSLKFDKKIVTLFNLFETRHNSIFRDLFHKKGENLVREVKSSFVCQINELKLQGS